MRFELFAEAEDATAAWPRAAGSGPSTPGDAPGRCLVWFYLVTVLAHPRLSSLGFGATELHKDEA